MLTLSHGPKLIYKSFKSKNEIDVKSQAHKFLFRRLSINDDVTLSDIFELLNADEVLISIFKADYASEYLSYYKKIKNKKAKTNLEFLELSKYIRYNSNEKKLEVDHNYHVSALSQVLKKDKPKLGVNKGERINYSISFAKLEELINLKLKIKNNTPVYEDDLYSTKNGQKLYDADFDSITLGELIGSILFELSFHGTPEETTTLSDSLKKQVKQIKKGKAKTVSADSLFEELDRPGIRKMFVAIKDTKPNDIVNSMRSIDDGLNMKTELTKIYEHIKIKKKYWSLNARGFREEFQKSS